MSAPFDERAAFAQLRSLMNRPELDSFARRDLWQLVQLGAEQAPEEYKDHWLTYMQGFPRHWSSYALTLTSLKELHLASTLLPFARFCLNLQGKGLGEDAIKTLSSFAPLRHVCRLSLGHNIITDQCVDLLARSPLLDALEALYLGRNHIGDTGARALAASPHCASLRTLDLQMNHIGDVGAMALADSPHLTRLETLYLTSNRIRFEGAHALAMSRALAGETLAERAALYIDDNAVGQLGIEVLISSQCVNVRGNLRTQLATQDW